MNIQTFNLKRESENSENPKQFFPVIKNNKENEYTKYSNI